MKSGYPIIFGSLDNRKKMRSRHSVDHIEIREYAEINLKSNIKRVTGTMMQRGRVSFLFGFPSAII